MSCTLVIEQGNTPVLQAVVRDSVTGAPIPGATVAVSITDSTGALVSGITWPVTLLPYGGAGVFRAVLSSVNGFVLGATYTAAFAITVAGVLTAFNYPLYIAPQGTHLESPASNAWQQPSLQQRLFEAQEAYHHLVMGRGVATIKDQNGEEVSYSITSRAALSQYIYSLQRQLKAIPPANPGRLDFREPRFHFPHFFAGRGEGNGWPF